MKGLTNLFKIIATISKYLGMLLIVSETISFFTSKMEEKYPGVIDSEKK